MMVKLSPRAKGLLRHLNRVQARINKMAEVETDIRAHDILRQAGDRLQKLKEAVRVEDLSPQIKPDQP